MTTQEFPNVEALRQQCTKIRQLASEALSGAIQRRDAVLTEVRHEEQRLASLSAERRMAEESLGVIHEEVERLMAELQLLGAEFSSPPRSTLVAAPVAAQAPAPAATAATAARADDSLDIVQDEMERLTRELELLGAELSPKAAWPASEASEAAASEWSRPGVPQPLARS